MLRHKSKYHFKYRENDCMRKFFMSLPVRLVIGVAIGIGLGVAANETWMNLVVTVQYVLNQLIVFCVPLIILGFIAPAITQLGQNATRLLGLAVTIAYLSSVGAALFSMAAGYGLLPHLSVASEVEGLKRLPEVVFQLDIPQIMPVMSALVFSMMLGLAAAWTNAAAISDILEEFRQIVLKLVTKIVIPILPFYIALTFCALSYEGTITRQLPVFLQVVLIVILGHYLWLALLYAIGGLYSGGNPLQVVKNYGPAYLTAVGTMSSAATLGIALKCAKNQCLPCGVIWQISVFHCLRTSISADPY